MKLLNRSLGTAFIALSLSPITSYAAAYPDRAITWIVPFAAGGPTDVMARNIANQVSQQLGQSIIVENAPGAGGTIGSARAAREKADGYSFLVGHIGYMAAAPSLYQNLRYDPVADFDAVFRFPDTPLVLLVREQSPFVDVGQLIEFGRNNPGKLNFSNAGVGSTSHLVGAMFAAQAGMQVESIAYKGAGPALNDLMGGQVDVMFDQTNTALPQVKGGRLKALALTSQERMEQFEHVPTLTEQALPGYQVSTWYGLYAPKGTPEEAIATMEAAYLAAMQNKEFIQMLQDQGIQLLAVEDYRADSFQQHTAAEVERWRDVIKQAGISLN